MTGTWTTGITASDGVTLAVHSYTEIHPQRPTILAIQGFPDNHHVWDGVAEILSERYNFVAHDVRGAATESKIGYAMRRISPSMIRLFARLDIRQTQVFGGS